MKQQRAPLRDVIGVWSIEEFRPFALNQFGEPVPGWAAKVRIQLLGCFHTKLAWTTNQTTPKRRRCGECQREAEAAKKR